MDDQRGWQERYGFVGWEVHHFVAVGGMAFVVLSPFFALVRGDAGFLAFVVGMLMFFLAAHTYPNAKVSVCKNCGADRPVAELAKDDPLRKSTA